MELVLTLKSERLREAARGNRPQDIRELLKGIPYDVLGGNPAVSVRVRVAEQDAPAVRSAVEGACTIGPPFKAKNFG